MIVFYLLLFFIGQTAAAGSWQVDPGLQESWTQAQDYTSISEETIIKVEKAINGMANASRPDFYNDNLQCHYDLAQIFQWTNETQNDGELLRQWRDYYGRRTPAIRDGAFRWVGVYDSCVDRFILPPSVPGEDETRAHYCWAHTRPGYGMQVGFCFPKSCSDEELIKFMPNIIEDEMRVRAFDHLQCIEQYTPLDSLAIGATVAFSTIALIVLLSTIYDMAFRMGWIGKDKFEGTISTTNNEASNGVVKSDVKLAYANHYTSSKWHQAALCFSFYTNSQKIWNVQNTEGPGTISCLHGLRVISLVWVIVGHVFGMGYKFTQNMVRAFVDTVGDFNYEWLMTADYSVDTFFFMSGLLTLYLGLKQVKKFKKSLEIKGLDKKNRVLSWVRFWAIYYFHRYWRLTPLLAALIFFTAALFRYSFPYKSPFWHDLNEGCPRVWWSHLIYINNIYTNEAHDMCQGHTWYLAADMQFYWFSPVVLLSFLVSPVLGGVLVLFGIIQPMLSSGIIHDQLSYPINENELLPWDDASGERFWKYYMVPWCRAGTYFIGMATGYLLSHGKRHIPAIGVMFGWFCSTLFALAITYGLYPIHHGLYHEPDWLAPLYWATNRFIWGCCMAWVVVACHWGYGGAVNHFLSHPCWRPLSRLNYAAYLFHVLSLNWYFLSQMTLMYFLKTSVTYTSIAIIVQTYAVAYVTSATLEAPLIGLEKLFLPRH